MFNEHLEGRYDVQQNRLPRHLKMRGELICDLEHCEVTRAKLPNALTNRVDANESLLRRIEKIAGIGVRYVMNPQRSLGWTRGELHTGPS